MKLIKEDDPRINFVYQGVQQNAEGKAYRVVELQDGTLAYAESISLSYSELNDDAPVQQPASTVATELKTEDSHDTQLAG